MRKVPKLRFKEFNDEWEEKKLEEIIINFIVPMRDKPKNLIGNIPWCRIEDFTGKYLYNSKSNQGVTKQVISEMNLKVFPIDTLLVSCSAYLGRCSIVKRELVTNQTFIGLFPDKNKLNIDYFYYLMLLQEKKLNLLSTGTTISYLSKEEFKKFKLYTSKILSEQEKIANFLSSIDKKISLTEEKLNLFKEYKKGIMQKIFSQELRFKDSNGNNYPNWEEKKLSKFLNEHTEKTTINNQYTVLSSTATGIFLQEEYFNRQIASSNNIGYKILKRNQLVFSPQNLWLGNININLKFDIGIVSPSYKIFNIDTSIILIKYLKNLLKLPKMLEEYKNVSEQGASVVRRNLDINLFLKLKLNLPCLEEQKKIADFLSSIDNKIEKIENEVENLKEFKKGLLQQMFV